MWRMKSKKVSRREFLKKASAGSLAARVLSGIVGGAAAHANSSDSTVPGFPTIRSGAPRKRNVLFISTDDCCNRLGIYGNPLTAAAYRSEQCCLTPPRSSPSWASGKPWGGKANSVFSRPPIAWWPISLTSHNSFSAQEQGQAPAAAVSLKPVYAVFSTIKF